MTDRDMFIDIKRRLDGIEARLDTLEALHTPSQLAPRGFADPDIDVAPRLTDDAFFDMATGGADPFHDTATRIPDDPGWRLDNPLQPLAIIAAACAFGWILWRVIA